MGSELADWILSAHGLGYTPHQLHEMMLDVGYTNADIEAALQEAIGSVNALHGSYYETGKPTPPTTNFTIVPHHKNRIAPEFVGIVLLLAVAAFSGLMLIWG